MVKDTNYDESDDYTEDEGASFPEEEEEDLKGLNLPRRSYEPIATEPFIEDPWPKTVFILMLIGFGIVLFTPPVVWAAWNYYLLLTYGLIMLVAVASIISIKVWKASVGSRLRYGGLANLIVVLSCGVAGLLDSFVTITTGVPLVTISDTPVLVLAFVIVIFSLYTLWLIQRTFAAEEPKR
jgi:hypothetical protein